MQVRRLNTGDIFRLVGLLAKYAGELKAELQAAGEMRQPADALLSGYSYTAILLRHAGTDLQPWLAELAGLGTEQLAQQPAEALLSILETVVEQEDLPGFFARAQRLLAKMTRRTAAGP